MIFVHYLFFALICVYVCFIICTIKTSKSRTSEQQQQKLKEQFGQSFIQAVNTFFNVKCTTEKQAYETFLDKHNYKIEKRKFWEVFSNIMNIPIKVLHDHFHNVYTKQFCDNFDDIRSQLIEIIQKHQNEDTKDVIQIMKETYPDRVFHYQTLYQFTNYYLKKRVSKKQIGTKQSKQNSSAQNVETTSSHESESGLKEKKNLDLQIDIEPGASENYTTDQQGQNMFQLFNLPTPKLFVDTVEQNTRCDNNNDIELYSLKDLVSYKTASMRNIFD